MKLVKTIGMFMKEHSPEILTALGIAGMITATVMAVKVTPAATKKVKEDSEKKHGNPDAYTPKEAVQSAWKYYIPTAALTIGSSAAIIGANKVSMNRSAALAAAYSISENRFNKYRKEVVEAIGEKKEQEIREKASTIVDRSVPTNTVDIHPGNGNTLCYETWSREYFWSDVENIRRAFNDLNYQLLNEDTVSANDMRYALNLPLGTSDDEFVWRVDNGPIEPSFSSQLTDNNQPCLVIDYIKLPEYYKK